MRTQDLDRFEQLAHRLAGVGTLDGVDDVDEVLAATGRTMSDLQARADVHRWRQNRAPRQPSPLEAYQEQAKIFGLHEGLVVVGTPILILLLAAVALGAVLVSVLV